MDGKSKEAEHAHHLTGQCVVKGVSASQMTFSQQSFSFEMTPFKTETLQPNRKKTHAPVPAVLLLKE